MMMNGSQRMHVRTYGTLLARFLVGGFFLYSGIAKAMGFAGTVGFIGSVGLPMPEVLAVLTILVEVGAGAALILGFHMGLAAAALAVFVVLASFIFHGPGSWSADPMQQMNFLKNMCIVAALLYMMAYGAGEG